MKKKNFLLSHFFSIIFLLLTLAVAYLIFFFSSQVGESSASESYGVSFGFAWIFIKNFDGLSLNDQNALISLIEPLIRKAAHFCIFCALGFFAELTVGSYCAEQKRAVKYFRTFAICAPFCLVYAASDELHQLFTSGRDGNITDVFIDFAGSFVGITVAFAVITVFLTVRRKKYKM